MRLVFIQKFVPHYRLPFFEQVRERLNRDGIEFVLIYGQPDPFEGSKVKTASPSWGIDAKSKTIKIFGRYIYWEGAYRYIRKGDLVVAEHAAKLLDNYIMFALCQIRWIKFGYFGHGENFQATNEMKIARILKELTVKKVSHWFAYTEVSRQSLLRQNISDDNITVVNNTLSNSHNDYVATTKPHPYKCVYIGGLYREKLIPLLIQAAAIVKETIPEFELHIIGDGPHSHYIKTGTPEQSSIVYHKSLYGTEKDAVVAQCNAILMPGGVGLIAIDSFNYLRPIITSDAGEHGPEIAYLENNINSLVDRGSVTAASYAAKVIEYLQNPELQASLKEGCLASQKQYTMDSMVDRFCQGVHKIIPLK